MLGLSIAIAQIHGSATILMFVCVGKLMFICYDLKYDGGEGVVLLTLFIRGSTRKRGRKCLQAKGRVNAVGNDDDVDGDKGSAFI